MEKQICGQPAVYFGALVQARPTVQWRPTKQYENIPFCEGCTRVSGWRHTFVSERPAAPGETCQAVLSSPGDLP